MTRSTREGLGLLGFGAVACAACCAGPVLGLLAAVGIGTALGVAAFGAVALAVGVLLVAVVLRRRRARACAVTTTAHLAEPTRKQDA